MLHFYSRKKIKQYTAGAMEYLAVHFESIGLSRMQTQKPASNQDKAGEAMPIRYSLKNSFDSRTVDRIMKDQQTTEESNQKSKELERHIDSSFTEHLCEYIKDKRLKDPEVYKAAQMDRRLFSKIMSDPCYQPSKDTAIALAFALHLSLEEANRLLSSAGFVLSHSLQRDVIIEYFFRNNINDLMYINMVLERMAQKVIGR